MDETPARCSGATSTEEDRRLRPDDPAVRSLTLLYFNQTPAQRAQCIERRCFEVIGGDTGTRYRLGPDLGPTVQELDGSGRVVASLGFYPSGFLPPGDVMLAQKIALELFERDVLAIACRNGVPIRNYQGANLYYEPRDDVERYARGGDGG
jgi:hypothetical protein